ncbi:MAG: DUF131 domain-containing protein [Nitrososphaerota archaeon]
MDLVLIFLGLGLVFVGGVLLLLAASLSRARVRGGGLILIGPIPVIFGDRSLGIILLIIALLALIPVILLMLIGVAG